MSRTADNIKGKISAAWTKVKTAASTVKDGFLKAYSAAKEQFNTAKEHIATNIASRGWGPAGITTAPTKDTAKTAATSETAGMMGIAVVAGLMLFLVMK